MAEPKPVYLDEKIKDVAGRGYLGYRSHELPTWCPGCGYFGMTQSLIEVAHAMQIPHHDMAIVSGIGCAGRAPIFYDSYGFHTIHGRALPVASGMKLGNRDLSVFVITGDGDCLGIGGGHLAHVARKNVDITCFLYDNNIYGLTKGQSSPTTPLGQPTNSHPYGNPDAPLNPMALALTYGATFAARCFAGEVEHMKQIYRAAIEHKGFSFVHCLSPCVTFDKQNITWQRMRGLLADPPPNHDTGNLTEAMRLAQDPRYITGLFYQDTQRPDYQSYLDVALADYKEKNK
jgi:2-oxoglutarate ferredoxin oxidoreductase subunit beta